MFEIPIGSAFEAFIDWLKDNFRGVFDFINAILDISINALERILLLDHQAVYPAMVVAILIGLVAFFLARKLPFRTRAVLGVVAAVLFGVVEIWRYQSLEGTLDPEEAGAMASEIGFFQDDLRELARDDYEEAQDLVRRAAALEPGNEDWQRTLSRIDRRFSRLRDGSFDRARDLVAEIPEAARDADVSLPQELRKAIVDTRQQLLAFTGIDEGERLREDLEEIEEPEPQYRFLNVRTFRETLAYLDAALDQAEAMGADTGEVQRWESLREQVSSLDPETLSAYPWIVMIALLTALAYLTGGMGLAVFAVIGFLLIASMQYWAETMETLALVLASTFFALLIGVPAGIWSARSNMANSAIRPILDFMQTMPAFVYLIPAVTFFGLGAVPGSIATLIFAMPPAVRLTALGIRQVPKEVVEAAEAFGATPRQMLFKAQLPIAMPTILAGLNQTIMLALSMVVIGGMIGAGGLGEEVLSGITQMKIDVGFESGIAVVILAIYLDRLTQHLGGPKRS